LSLYQAGSRQVVVGLLLLLADAREVRRAADVAPVAVQAVLEVDQVRGRLEAVGGVRQGGDGLLGPAHRHRLAVRGDDPGEAAAVAVAPTG